MKGIHKVVSRLNNDFKPLPRDADQIESLAGQDAANLYSIGIDSDLGIGMSTNAAGANTASHRAKSKCLTGIDEVATNDRSVDKEGEISVSEQISPVVGVPEGRRLTLPLEQFKSKGMITPDLPKSAIAEEFRSIKRPLLTNMATTTTTTTADEEKELANVVMVTSCVEREGKTFTAFNLAMSLAMERERTVLLIDSDVAKATASNNLGLNGDQPGLTDLLMDPSMKIDDVIYHTNVDNLQFMSAGLKTDHATELLASDGMSKLLTHLSQQFRNRIIVFDAPPVLMTSEAIVLAERVGQIVFVVGAESVTQGMVADALNRIRGKAWIGLVLNKIRKKMASSYGYGYGQDSRRSTDEGGSGAV